MKFLFILVSFLLISCNKNESSTPTAEKSEGHTVEHEHVTDGADHDHDDAHHGDHDHEAHHPDHNK